MRTIFFTMLLLASVFNGYSQIITERQIEIGGLTLRQAYSVNQVTSIMGTPQSYAHEFDVCDEHKFVYDDNVFYICDGVFVGFKLVNNRYKLNGVVGVGDTFNEIHLLNPFNIISTARDNGITIHEVFITNKIDDMSPIYFRVRNGAVFEISYLYVDDV